MDRLRDPLLSIVLVIVIGGVCGTLAHRFLRRAWFAEQRGALLTQILVGIAGAFLGFHAAMLGGLGVGHPIVPFVVTAAVAGLVLGGWRARGG